MATNFDYLLEKELFGEFAEQAVEAEKAIAISPATCAILSRRALELAVRFVYSYDYDLKLPYRDNVSSLIHEQTFRDIIEPGLFGKLKYVIKLGNIAVHTNNSIKRDDALLSLRNLFCFCDWIDYSYSKEYHNRTFKENIVPTGKEESVKASKLKELYESLSGKDKKLDEVLKENENLRIEMAKLREENIKNRTYQVDEISEAKTRKYYIDLELKEAGWIIGKNVTEEEEVTGMPNASGIGYVDYVLWGKDNLPLAVVEAKKSTVDPKVGSHQAKLYADCLQNKYNQRPLIFTTNGFEFYYKNDYMNYAEREVSGFFTQDELQLEVDRRKLRTPLVNVEINDKITDRPYQKEAVLAVCDAIEKRHRKMLIVQATGSGKTRVSISIVDVLRKHNYIKNILFLADRTALVRQAKKNFSNLLPDLTCCNLLDYKDDPENSKMIFSTYATMMNMIDEKKNKFGEKLFTPGHFDLIIIDESHRSIYKKYQDIFFYFDAMLIGMTATPKTDVDKDTYAIFDLERGNPTFAYELETAVEEGYLVNYSTIETNSKFIDNGICYKDLSEEEKEEFEDTFDDDPVIEDTVLSSELNTWVYNTDTIDSVLSVLLDKGIKVEGGDKLGKTIIFAKNNRHAKAIVDRFLARFPEYGGDFIKEIDYSIKYVDSLIDDFSDKNKMPQIAVSVDMLDTGIDIPEITNLVFFKKVKSYAKFWQMVGRGTRLCKDLFGEGLDKEKFLIFDWCRNFEYFRANKNGTESGIQESLAEKIFNVKVQITRELEKPENVKNEKYSKYRNDLVAGMHQIVMDMNDDSFRVKRHLRYVEKYRNFSNWQSLEANSVSELKNHVAPLVMPEKSDELVRRFDYLMHTINLGILQRKNISKPIDTVVKTAVLLSKKYNIPAIQEQRDVIEKVQKEEFWENATIIEIDYVRTSIRNLLQYIDKIKRNIYYTNFTDKISEPVEGQPISAANNLKNYKKQVEFYLKQHQDTLAVHKLRNNEKLTRTDLDTLEHILWTELGSKADYENEYGDTPVGKMVRRIVGLDREAVNKAFNEFLNEERLNVNQYRFVRLIIDYIVKNGNIEDNKVLTEEPFRSAGSITSLFKNDMATAKQIMMVIKQIQDNSVEVA